MKEFTSQTGGRYTYIDDILNLQELALAFTSLFDGCENFIISGCQVTEGKIEPGYVYINGKIRYCAGTSSATTWPMYIYESNKTEKVSYVDAGDKVGRNVFDCAIANSVPTSNDAITNKPPQSISIQQDGKAVRLGEALFGKYAVLFDPVNASQTIEKLITFNDKVTAKRGLDIIGDIQSIKGNNIGIVSIDDSGNLTIKLSANNNANNYSIQLTQDGKFKFIKNGACIATINSDGSEFMASVSSSIVKSNAIAMSGNQIYNYNLAADNGLLSINMCGYNGNKTYYRNTEIGDGKGVALLTVNGKSHTISMSKATIASEGAVLVLKNVANKYDDNALQGYIEWHDQDGKAMARIGYDSAANKNLNIYNAYGDVTVGNTVRITGELYVNGKLISSTYVSNEDYESGMGNKANTNDVYTKTYIDQNIPLLKNGLGDYVKQLGGGEKGKAALRKAIDAVSVTELSQCNTTLATKANEKEVYKKAVADTIFAKLSDGFTKFVAQNGGDVAGQSTLRKQIGACAAVDLTRNVTELTKSINTKANSNDVYTKGQLDKDAAFVMNGFSQFVKAIKGSESEAKAQLRLQIGAAASADLSKYVSLSQNFKDIVSEGLNEHALDYLVQMEAKQRTLCRNLGAAFAKDVENKPKDTGWKRLALAGGSSEKGLFARQIGHIVCIQGDITPPHGGEVFTLPSDIEPPTYKVGMCHIHRKGWQCAIDGGSKTCYVTKCDGGCHNNIGFLITYMV